MSCGDCDFETHYESELFLHLKVHIGKEDEVGTTVVTCIKVPTSGLPEPGFLGGAGAVFWCTAPAPAPTPTSSLL